MAVWQSRGQILWTDQNSKVHDNFRAVQDLYGVEPRASIISIQPRSGNNVLTAEHILDIFALWETIKAVKTKTGKGFTDVCQKNSFGYCSQNSVLSFWNYANPNATLFNTTAGNPTALAQWLLQPDFPGTSQVVAWESFSTGVVKNRVVPSVTATSIAIGISLRGKYPGSGVCLTNDCGELSPLDPRARRTVGHL
jgi:hypothetical protein